MVQPFQQIRTMLGIVNIIDFVLPNVLSDMVDDDVGFVGVGDLEHLMKNGHVDSEFLDNQEDIHVQLFTTASFLELLQALNSVTKGQQVCGQHFSKGGQVP